MTNATCIRVVSLVIWAFVARIYHFTLLFNLIPNLIALSVCFKNVFSCFFQKVLRLSYQFNIIVKRSIPYSNVVLICIFYICYITRVTYISYTISFIHIVQTYSITTTSNLTYMRYHILLKQPNTTTCGL